MTGDAGENTSSPARPLAAAIPERMTPREHSPPQPWTGGGGNRAWLASTLVHTLIFVMLAILWKPVIRGTGGVVDRPAGIAVVTHSDEGRQFELQGGGPPADAASAAEIAAAATGELSSEAAREATDRELKEMLGPLAAALEGVQVDAAAAAGTGAAGVAGQGAGGDRRGDATLTKTSFMGIEGEGSSFVYVLDRSDSMTAYEGAPLERATRELADSIASLTRVNQFQIIFYNDSPSPYRGSLSRTGGLIFANDIEKQAAKQFVRGVEAFGGTEHFPAVSLGLRMAPDVLFFLTDAADPSLSGSQVDRLVAMAERAGTTIHTVQFGVGGDSGDGRWIEQLARRTRGQYRFVDVTQFLRPAATQ